MSIPVNAVYPRRLLAALLLAITLWGSGCSDDDATAADSGGLTTDPASPTSAIRVLVAAATERNMAPVTRVTGEVSAFRKTTLAAETSGRVTARRIEPGQQLEAGQILFELDDTRPSAALRQAEANLQARSVDLQQARSELARGENLLARQFISQDDLDTLRFAVDRAEAVRDAGRAAVALARQTLADTHIRSPFTGTAEQVMAQLGDYLQPGTPVAVLADFSRARIHAGVTARKTALLATGTTADVVFDDLDGLPLRGEIQSLARIADTASGTYAVEIWVTGSDAARLREGMLASVALPYESAAARLTVPAAAVFRQNGALHVFTVSDDTAHLQAVKTGRSESGYVEILDGLAPGQRVVVSGQFALREGASVQIMDSTDTDR